MLAIIDTAKPRFVGRAFVEMSVDYNKVLLYANSWGSVVLDSY